MLSDPFLNQSQDQGGMAIPSLNAGQILFNQRYELLRQLGAGGMGVVWLARDHTEQTEVALKFLPTVLVLQESEMKRLRDEVRTGKELRHPKIVATYGLEIENATAAIVMEYVPGKTLRELLEEQERGFFEPEEITPWIKDISEALDYLHTKAKRIHRDLKPANIIVDANGEARLMDFGISHRIQEGVTRHSQSSVVPPLGGSQSEPAKGGTTKQSSSTLAYASPQQISGKPAHPSDDIYSLGATLYELLTGTPPFYRGGTEAVAIQIKMEPVTPVMERRAELVEEGLNASAGTDPGQAWESLLQTCLAKERESRPSASATLLSASPMSPPAEVAAPQMPQVEVENPIMQDAPSQTMTFQRWLTPWILWGSVFGLKSWALQAYIISSSDKGQAAGLANLLGLGIALVEAFVIWWFITRLWPLSLKWLFIGPASNLCFNLVCRLPVQDNRDLANTLMSSFRESWGYEVAAIAYQVFTTLCFLMLATLPQSLLLRKHLGKWWLWWCGQYVAAKLFYMVFSWLVFQVLGGGSYQVVFYPLFSFISMALCLWIIYRRQHMAS